MQDQLTVRVSGAGSPLLEWHCPRCRRRQPYASTNAFRANANGKLIDVWLIYRCFGCDSTKNLTIAERVAVSRMDPMLLAAAEGNDEFMARRCARDLRLIKGNGARVVAEERWRLTPPSPRLLARPHGTEVALEMAEPLLLALRGPVAATLDISGSGVDRLLASGQLKLDANVSVKTLHLWSAARFVVAPGPGLIRLPSGTPPRENVLGAWPKPELPLACGSRLSGGERSAPAPQGPLETSV